MLDYRSRSIEERRECAFCKTTFPGMLDVGEAYFGAFVLHDMVLDDVVVEFAAAVTLERFQFVIRPRFDELDA